MGVLTCSLWSPRSPVQSLHELSESPVGAHDAPAPVTPPPHWSLGTSMESWTLWDGRLSGTQTSEDLGRSRERGSSWGGE